MVINNPNFMHYYKGDFHFFHLPATFASSLIPSKMGAHPLVNQQVAGWKIPIFNSIFKTFIFHYHLSLPEGNLGVSLYKWYPQNTTPKISIIFSRKNHHFRVCRVFPHHFRRLPPFSRPKKNTGRLSAPGHWQPGRYASRPVPDDEKSIAHLSPIKF